jgi:hypothetical protein
MPADRDPAKVLLEACDMNPPYLTRLRSQTELARALRICVEALAHVNDWAYDACEGEAMTIVKDALACAADEVSR